MAHPSKRRLEPIPRAHHRGAEYWEEKLVLNPENGRAHRMLAPLVAERGARGVPGAKEQAEQHLKHAVHYAPGDDAARNDLGVVLLAQGKTLLAIAQFQEGLRRTPNSSTLHKNLAAAFGRCGNFKLAILHAHEVCWGKCPPSPWALHTTLLSARAAQS
jgi:Flp pilus assembly protein TadD